jgi:hypothetical protein
MNEAAWVLVGAIVTTAVDAYATHISSHRDDRFRGYLAGLARSLIYESPRFFAALPTIVFLLLAAIFRWHDDHRNPDGSMIVGYTTVGLNLNVLLLFILGIVATRRGRFSLRGTLLFAAMNAGIGLLIVVAEVALE